jgi:hypothetical protein
MEKLASEVTDARKRVAALVEITRWLWVINAIVMVVGIYYSSYQVAALAGFTLVVSLIAAAVARRASSYLRAAVRTIRSS